MKSWSAWPHWADHHKLCCKWSDSREHIGNQAIGPGKSWLGILWTNRHSSWNIFADDFGTTAVARSLGRGVISGATDNAAASRATAGAVWSKYWSTSSSKCVSKCCSCWGLMPSLLEPSRRIGFIAQCERTQHMHSCCGISGQRFAWCWRWCCAGYGWVIRSRCVWNCCWQGPREAFICWWNCNRLLVGPRYRSHNIQLHVIMLLPEVLI